MFLVHSMFIVDYPYEDSAKAICWCPWNNGHDHQMRSIAVQGWIPTCEYGKSCDVLENREQMVTNTIKYVQKRQIRTFAIFLSEQIVIFRAVYASYMSPQLPLSGWKSCDDVPQERCLVSTRIDANRCGSATVYHSFGWGSDNDFGGSQGALISYPTQKPLGNETLEMPSSVARHLWCYGLLKLFMHYFLQENLSWKADKFLGQWKTTATSPQQVAFKKGQAVNMVMATANRSS